MAVSARLLDHLAQIKQHGPGSPEAIAAIAAWSEDEQQERIEADRDRRLESLERENVALRAKLGMIEDGAE